MFSGRSTRQWLSRLVLSVGLLGLRASLAFYVLFTVLRTFVLDSPICLCRFWSRNLASRYMDVVNLKLVVASSYVVDFFLHEVVYFFCRVVQKV